MAPRPWPEPTIIQHPYPAEALHGRARGRFWKVVCDDAGKLAAWARANGIPAGWIHRSRRGVWHIDLWGRTLAAIFFDGAWRSL